MRSLALALMLLFSITVFAEEKPTFNMTTTAFLDNGALPVMYTCDGRDFSPQISWADVPTKAKMLALIMSDPAAPSGTWYHWVVYNLPITLKELAEGSPSVSPALMGKNSWGKSKYNGPCPPRGSVHSYIFTLYALDTKLDLKADATADQVIQAMHNHIVGETKLTAVYSRWLK